MKCSRTKFIRLIIYFLITIGFSYQSLSICLDYFKFTTTTFVSVQILPPQLVIPKLVLCFSIDLFNYTSLAKIFKTSSANKVTFTRSFNQTGNCNDITKLDGSLVNFGQFLKGKAFCLSFSTSSFRALRTMEDVNACQVYQTALFGFHFNTTLNERWEGQLGDTKNYFGVYTPIFSYMIPFDSDFDGPIRPSTIVFARKSSTHLTFRYTYAMSVSKLAPPPYDTSCFDYTKHGFTSKFNCINKCEKDIITKHGFLHDRGLVLDRKHFENSTLQVLPFHKNADHLSDQQLMQFLKGNGFDNESQRLYFPKLKVAANAQLLCRKSCSRPDCFTEMLSPSLVIRNEHGSRQDGENETSMNIALYQPSQPVLLVESKAKNYFIDFVVYLSSCLGFWFGFCPLYLANRINQKLKAIQKRRRINDQQFVSMDTLRQITESIELRMQSKMESQINSLVQENQRLKLLIRENRCRITRLEFH